MADWTDTLEARNRGEVEGFTQYEEKQATQAIEEETTNEGGESGGDAGIN